MQHNSPPAMGNWEIYAPILILESKQKQEQSAQWSVFTMGVSLGTSMEDRLKYAEEGIDA